MTARTNPIRATLALTLALGALAPATASARIALDAGTPVKTPASRPAVQVDRVSTQSGFDWADAGIGAAGAFGLLMVAAGGVVVVRRHPTLR